MMENTKKPAIRFKGYTEAWEQGGGEVSESTVERLVGVKEYYEDKTIYCSGKSIANN